ncbi:FAD-binding protein [Microbispora siamensis]|nr:FAD-binding protein [Microbispora siamensis]
MRRSARVQPGVICDRLRDAAAPYGLTFGPDSATHDHATIGGIGRQQLLRHPFGDGRQDVSA